jgi:hypothetical protein
MFNLIGHQPRLRLNPTGIAVINLRTMTRVEVAPGAPGG